MVTSESSGTRPAGTDLRRGLVVIGIVLTALSLRSAVTSLGVVLDQVRESLDISATLAGVITALPVICFAGFGAVAPALSRRIGEQQVVLVGVIAIAVGLGGRAAAGEALGFVTGSVLALAGIAVANIVLPSLIKRHFPHRVGLMMGIYSMSAAASVALPAGVTVPLSDATGYGWRGGLGSWAVFAAVAMIPWMVLLRTGRHEASTVRHDQPRGCSTAALLRSRTALSLTAFFGLQSLNAYVMMGWLPAILTSAGLTSHNAALMLSVSALIAIPISLALPRIATRRDSQRRYVVAIVAGGLAGYLGLLLAPTAAPLLWVMLLASLHGAFPLAVTLIALRAREPATATQLSGFVQSGGYVLAALGPLAIGALNDLTTTWTVPLIVLITTLVLELIVGLIAAQPRHVETELATAR
ncbi:CynX/NimT family MFS transporter [Saccharopolyspora mangrovi]|uniref:MFS transporter n=1 Tax=Saccharopolyspora mangrovi TaxID=3082379 RepID=A0ABU6A4T6_9PSEU|nr:MFS transporter [Saccharopolyspora sp. S2-29]MEB3366578.1 MFS transporter [Saccharopolyspora sp. S2-29]